MQINDTIGATFGAVRIQQTWTALFMLEKILIRYKPDEIIELGTGYGALTKFLSMFAFVHTFDIQAKFRLIPRNAVFQQADVFNKATINLIKSLINLYGRTFLLCDDGNKPKEFNTYAPLLKKGDLIFAHDWGEEIYLKDIQETILKLHLTWIPEQAELDELKTKLIGFIK